MNKHNLIKLGALAQKKFNMKDNFEIMELPSDAQNIIRVAIPAPAEWNSPSVPIDFDDVNLEKFGSTDNYEYIWCGYSARANVFLVCERANKVLHPTPESGGVLPAIESNSENARLHWTVGDSPDLLGLSQPKGFTAPEAGDKPAASQ